MFGVRLWCVILGSGLCRAFRRFPKVPWGASSALPVLRMPCRYDGEL
ncbi:hypothetical protein HAT2_00206 [Candidatus Similichlamydia laticola]|uniref:Uncharacterized protein n=1 Tax=Candidatus Similichlamydia laticola TaxID=2170265 RepID=A0A369KFL6_9BACT|nr:hypothetical protein HAT2_00206 [Candidatus Similichlamydia laticola]